MSWRTYSLIATKTLAASALILVGNVAVGADKKEDAETRRIVANYGSCMVSHKHDQSKAFVLSTDDIPPPKPIDTCVGESGTLRMSGAIYRMVFAEALLKHDFPLGLPAGFVPDANATGAVSLTGEPLDFLLGIVGRLDALGQCATRRDPATSYRWIRTRPSSSDEDAIVGKILPTLKACGLAVVLPQSINNVRGAVATNLYRAAVKIAAAGVRPH